MCHLYSCWWVNTLKPTNSSTSLVALASGSWSCSEMLYQWQHNAKSYYDKQSRDFPPLEVGDKVRCRQNSEREWCKAEVMPRSYMLEDEYRCAYRRNRRQIISVPNDSPMTNLPTSWLSSEYKTCTCIWEPAPSPVTLERLTETVSHTPITTRSRLQVRRLQRLIVWCWGGDVVTLKPVGIPLRRPWLTYMHTPKTGNRVCCVDLPGTWTC